MSEYRAHRNTIGVVRKNSIPMTNIAQLKDSVPYREHYEVHADSKHIGRLKLLVNDFSFIDQYCSRRQRKHEENISRQKKTIVVYFGASPGYHIPYLVRYFRRHIHRWILIDPEPLAPGLAEMRNVVSIDKSLRVGEVETLRHHWVQNGWTDIVFLSDIRTGVDDCHIRADNCLQNDYYFALEPRSACMKLRFPFREDGISEKICVPKTSFKNWKLQAFARLRSTELRLWINNPVSSTSCFDHSFVASVHDKMCAFNMYCRPENDIRLVRYVFRHVLAENDGDASIKKYVNSLLPGIL